MARKGKLEMLANMKNKDVILPFKIAWARQPEMSIHEQRVLLRIMEHVNAQLKGVRISDNLRKIEPTTDAYKITMPTSDAFVRDMKPEDMEYELMCLSRRVFQYKDSYHWWACGYIDRPEIVYGSGLMTFEVFKPFWEVLLNFVDGFREIELTKALLLPTTYSLRFYILISGKTKPLYFSVEDFKKWLGIEPHLYKDKNGKDRIDNLENRVIKPAKKALDESCPYTFTYEKVRENPNSKRSPVIGFRFYSVYQSQFRDPELEKNSLMARVSPRFLVGEDIYRYLKDNFDYTQESLRSNKKIIHEWQELEKDPLGWLSQRRRAAHDSDHGPIAYICGAMKRRIAELKAQQNSTSEEPSETTTAQPKSTNPPQQTQPNLFNFDDIASGIADKFGFK